jgi:hypothetical protein
VKSTETKNMDALADISRVMQNSAFFSVKSWSNFGDFVTWQLPFELIWHLLPENSAIDIGNKL